MSDRAGSGSAPTIASGALAPTVMLLERLAAARLDRTNLMAWIFGGVLGIALGAGILLALLLP